MAVNKVAYGNNTLIDLTDTTAVASDVASGKYFYGKDGVRTQGTASGGGGVTDTVTQISGGGDYHAIAGQTISGTLSVTENGTYDVTSYESAEVNVSGGGGGSEYGCDYIQLTATGTPTQAYAWGYISTSNNYYQYAKQNFGCIACDQFNTRPYTYLPMLDNGNLLLAVFKKDSTASYGVTITGAVKIYYPTVGYKMAEVAPHTSVTIDVYYDN